MRIALFVIAAILSPPALCWADEVASHAQPSQLRGSGPAVARPQSNSAIFLVRTVGGEKIEARGLAISSPRVLVLQTDSGERRLAMDDLDSLQVLPASTANRADAVQIVLTDGTVIHASAAKFDHDKLKVEVPGERPMEVSMRTVSLLRLKPLTKEQKADWEELTSSKERGDHLIIQKKDSSLAGFSGEILEVADNGWKFKLSDQETHRVSLDKIHTGVFYHAAPDAGGAPEAVLEDAQGGRFPMQSLSLNGNELSFKTPAGLQGTRNLANIRSIEFAKGESVSLTSLKPSKVQFQPFFDIGQKEDDKLPRTGKSFYGPLQMDGETFHDGLSIHSRTVMSYWMDKPYRLFRAKVGIDDSVRPDGAARLVIKSDGKVVFDRAFTGKDASVPIQVPLDGKKSFQIEVDYANKSDAGGILDIISPTFKK